MSYPPNQEQLLQEIFNQLLLVTGHDFSDYKRPSLLRRIQRRINATGLSGLSDYAAYIQQQPEEAEQLLKSILISVTQFFRDDRSFQELEQVILPLVFKTRSAEQAVRIWVAGCATGEEAYSIAMLCIEYASVVKNTRQVQVFATDIDATALNYAREGCYTLGEVANVSQERLERFFDKEGEGYCVRQEIKDIVRFTNHNFIEKPPFQHIDLISCRNVLIYLNPSAQEQVMINFHAALQPGGFLFLGNAESISGVQNLYTVFSREHQIYRSC